MGVTRYPDQAGQPKPARVVRRGRVKRSKPAFERAGRPSTRAVIDALVQAGVFDQVFANIKLKYGIR
ncbi:MAG: hypothetical protein KGQ41_04370 [Alphaproteobacteria bacterium]|nr:hypothetical protein [Alphaproteobacteria bacterium]